MIYSWNCLNRMLCLHDTHYMGLSDCHIRCTSISTLHIVYWKLNHALSSCSTMVQLVHACVSISSYTCSNLFTVVKVPTKVNVKSKHYAVLMSYWRWWSSSIVWGATYVRFKYLIIQGNHWTNTHYVSLILRLYQYNEIQQSFTFSCFSVALGYRPCQHNKGTII